MSFDYNEDYLGSLIQRPQESLSVELKNWLNPNQSEHLAKIVKTCIALRNQNGGCLVLGFRDDTGEPDLDNVPDDLATRYHVDIIQGAVSRYASEAFEVDIKYPERDGLDHPVICVPDGVRTPVAAKRDLKSDDGRSTLIKSNTVYVRSLNSNNTPSTTQATWKDWNSIAEICFINRESDIGRFIRRNLTEDNFRVIQDYFSNPESTISPRQEISKEFSTYCTKRFEDRVKKVGMELPETGFFEVTVQINGEIQPYEPNRSFYRLLASSNPRHTGWPLWIDSTGFIDRSSQPIVQDGGWEALIVSIDERDWDHIDFWRMDPRGMFYHKRAFEVDLRPSPFKSGSILDFVLIAKRVAEAISVVMAFSKSMKCNPENTTLEFVFNWTGLSDRVQDYWADRELLSYGAKAYQDDVSTDISIPLDTSPSKLYTLVHEICKPVFQVFEGTEFNIADTERLTEEVLRNRY